jgi:hypothetical protein
LIQSWAKTLEEPRAQNSMVARKHAAARDRRVVEFLRFEGEFKPLSLSNFGLATIGVRHRLKSK